MNWRPLGALGIVIAAVAGVVVGLAVRGGPAAPAAPAPAPVATATIVRTDLSSATLTGGTLGYAPADPIVDQLVGIYTELPSAGTVIRPGGVLYAVDNLPVVLMRGRTPAWRGFELGMGDGPDVSELQANLIALGYAGGLFTGTDGHFGWATVAAVERWQLSRRQPVTGLIPLGQIVFLPSSVRVEPGPAAVGQAATPGQSPYAATTTARAVTVAASPALPPIRVGERVSIILPSGNVTPGTVTMVASAAGAAHAAATITISPSRPAATGTGTGVAVQVSLTITSVRGVLAAPIPALLALGGGGYGLEVVERSGKHRLVGVRTGVFTGSQVEVSGSGIAAGTRVVVAQ